MDRDQVELGVSLLAAIDADELALPDVMDRIETVTGDPATAREILDTADRRGVIDREEGLISTRQAGGASAESTVVSREGDFSCRRCGTTLTTGYFVRLDAGDHGPFGSQCIRIVTGRE